MKRLDTAIHPAESRKRLGKSYLKPWNTALVAMWLEGAKCLFFLPLVEPRGDA